MAAGLVAASMNHRELSEVSASFWRLAGGPQAFPRSLEEPILWALPLAVVRLPRLGLVAVRAQLRRLRVECPFSDPDRLMRGCLVARRGEGLVFLDGADPANEQGFSLAHELAHFLLDYHLPRTRALDRLGPGVREILDGDRPPSPGERIDSLLQGVSIKTYGHLMDRTWTGEVAHLQTLEAEDRADRLALELLAPRTEVLRVLASSAPQKSSQLSARVVDLLCSQFGLPGAVAERYAPLLTSAARPRMTFREWLGTAPT